MDRMTLAIFAGTAFSLLAACSSPSPQTGVLYPPQPGTIPTPPRDFPPGEPGTFDFCWSDSLGGYFPGKKQCDPRYDSVSASEFRERREAKALAAFFEAYPDAANENFLADRFDMAAGHGVLRDRGWLSDNQQARGSRLRCNDLDCVGRVPFRRRDRHG